MALEFRTVIKGKPGTRARKEWVLTKGYCGQADNLTKEGNLLATSVPDSLIRSNHTEVSWHRIMLN